MADRDDAGSGAEAAGGSPAHAATEAKRSLTVRCTESTSGKADIVALEEPTFLIRAGGKLYMTVAVLGYDLAHDALPHGKKEALKWSDAHVCAIDALRDVLEQGRTVDAVEYDPETYALAYKKHQEAHGHA